jgi:DNA polymerase-3 subunit alpha
MANSTKVSLKPSDYVHLHNHTQYSLLDGLTKIPALIEYVHSVGMEAVSITDHGTLSGVIEFYKEAKAKQVKPIIGMETYVAARTISDREPSKDKNNYHLILLAMNNEGYQNLLRLSTTANLEGTYYKPRVDHALLEKYNKGLIVLSACIGGEIADNLRNGQHDKAKEIASWYKKTFKDRYYLEVQDHGHPDHPSKWDEQVAVNTEILKLSEELDIPCVLTCDAHYLRHEDQEAHEILLCVQTGSFLTDEKRMSLKEFELHVTDPKDIIKRWGNEHPELITNSRAIADRCDVNIELGKILIPKFSVPKGETEKSYLHKLAWRGLAWRYGDVGIDASTKLSEANARKKLTPEIITRAEYELDIMDSMGFNGYFLIVQDFMGWGKDQGIVFGPGRGSAAGSIIAYALRITEIEPLGYKLMFERFLNPSRISMPDIDIDIQDTRRDEVIKYCVEKYGSDRVANIVTFGRMAARNAVRDVARVLQVPYAEADRLAKMIPPPVQGRHILLKTSLEENAELKAEYATSETAKRVFDLAVQLEGTIRSHGVHAAGVVIAPDDIVKFVPLEMAQKGVVATQYPMGPIEELGLLKMDFLGLSNLTVLNNALRIIRRVYGDDLDLSTIPNDDPQTFALLQRADTTGVFQLESAGMKRY